MRKPSLAAWEWTGTALQIAGATVVASRVAEPIVGYSTMLPGSLIWLAVAMYRPNWALALMQSAFVAINLIGIIRWMA